MISNLTNQYISQSFQNLVQYSGSGELFDGLSNGITNLQVTASNATTSSFSQQSLSSSFASTASYALNASTFPFTGSAKITGSLTVTGSLNQIGETSLNVLPNVSLTSRKTSSVGWVPGLLAHTGSHITFNHEENDIKLTSGLMIGSSSVSGQDFPANVYANLVTSGSDAVLYKYFGWADPAVLGGEQQIVESISLVSTGSLGTILFGIDIFKNADEQGTIDISRVVDNSEVISLSIQDNQTAIRIANTYLDSNTELFKVLNSNFDDIFKITNSSVQVTSPLYVSGTIFLNTSGTLVIPTVSVQSTTGSMYVDTVNNLLFVFTGNGGNNGWVSASLF